MLPRAICHFGFFPLICHEKTPCSLLVFVCPSFNTALLYQNRGVTLFLLLCFFKNQGDIIEECVLRGNYKDFPLFTSTDLSLFKQW